MGGQFDGKVALVTGGNAGIGEASALHLRPRGRQGRHIGQAGGGGRARRQQYPRRRRRGRLHPDGHGRPGAGRGDGRDDRIDVRRPRLRLQQRGHRARRGPHPRAHRGALGLDDRHQPEGPVALPQVRDTPDDRTGRRRRRQQLVRVGNTGRRRTHGLPRQQGRRQLDNPHRGTRVRPPGHPRQCGAARRHPHPHPRPDGGRDARHIGRDRGKGWSSAASALPEEIANAVVWLCSDDASFVNGVLLSLDGGTTAGRFYQLED